MRVRERERERDWPVCTIRDRTVDKLEKKKKKRKKVLMIERSRKEEVQQWIDFSCLHNVSIGSFFGLFLILWAARRDFFSGSINTKMVSKHEIFWNV